MVKVIAFTTFQDPEPEGWKFICKADDFRNLTY